MVPDRKVAVGGAAGALVLIIVWALNTYLLPMDKPITAEVSTAATVVVTFIVQYFVPNKA